MRISLCSIPFSSACAQYVDYRYIIHSKTWGNWGTKGYSFQDDEKTIIYNEIDMYIVVEKEKNEWMRKMWTNIFWKIWNFKIG